MTEPNVRTFAPDHEPSDVVEFVEGIRNPADAAVDGLFTADRPILVARAPGRLDVMGGIADYSGSLGLELPIAEATVVAAQAVDDADVRVVSLAPDGEDATRTYTVPSARVRELATGSYDAACECFRATPDDAWAAYVVGVLIVLARETDVPTDGGWRILIDSRVPEGKGVSSSAALEVAVMQAIAHARDAAIEGAELARLCQIVENRVVGAPCGIMDQMTSALGRSDQLLALLCQPADVQGYREIPSSIRFWGIDSGIRHAVSGADYGSVRTGAFMGHRILADLHSLEVSAPAADGVVTIDDTKWHGCLANVFPAQFRVRYAECLPETMRGNKFLQRYRGTADAVTRVDPDRTYAVRQPTAHPVFEHERVTRFAALLDRGVEDDAARKKLGELMFGSHESYSACGLGSDGTDLLVELVREAGPDAGLWGAKITGGGSGGTVAVLGNADASAAIAKVADEYTQRTGRETFVFSGSSDGACEFGVVRVEC